jgi:hypothetical protein
MAGLLNLVPRYLPRYGMAPEWTKASRPLVLLFTAITFVITILFNADVEAQGGAYATGVLVLMTSAAVAVTLNFWGRGRAWAFGAITLVFVYTTIANIIERPDGVKIAAWFIATIIITSMISRVARSTELRIQTVETDAGARRFIQEAGSAPVRIIANRPRHGACRRSTSTSFARHGSRTTCPRRRRSCSSRSGLEMSRSSRAI